LGKLQGEVNFMSAYCLLVYVTSHQQSAISSQEFPESWQLKAESCIRAMNRQAT
jgi:hypothetical protein